MAFKVPDGAGNDIEPVNEVSKSASCLSGESFDNHPSRNTLMYEAIGGEAYHWTVRESIWIDRLE